MPTVSLKKQHYDAIVRMGFEPTVVVNTLLDIFTTPTNDEKSMGEFEIAVREWKQKLNGGGDDDKRI